MAGEFVGQVEAFPGVFAQDPAYDIFGFAVVVGPGGVKVVYAVFHGIGYHFFSEGLVNAAVGASGKPHGAEAQQAQLLILEFREDHGKFLLFV